MLPSLWQSNPWKITNVCSSSLLVPHPATHSALAPSLLVGIPYSESDRKGGYQIERRPCGCIPIKSSLVPHAFFPPVLSLSACFSCNSFVCFFPLPPSRHPILSGVPRMSDSSFILLHFSCAHVDIVSSTSLPPSPSQREIIYHRWVSASIYRLFSVSFNRGELRCW